MRVSKEGRLSDDPLPAREEIINTIWGAANVKAAIDLINGLDEAKGSSTETRPPEQGPWVLAMISWFLSVVAQSKGPISYHYYFFRALPDKRDDFFHTSGHGLLSWASCQTTLAPGATALRQDIALTACFTLSRLSDALMPYYERRDVLQSTQGRLLKQELLLTVLEEFVLPVMLGSSLKRVGEGRELMLVDSDNPKPIVCPLELKEFIDTLVPMELWKPSCNDSKEQLKYLLELIAPLHATEAPSRAVETFASIRHDLNKIGLSSSNQAQNQDKAVLLQAKTRLAAAGTLFVPTQVALEEVRSAFEARYNQESAGTHGPDDLAAKIMYFGQSLDTIGKFASFDALCSRFQDGVEHPLPCGKALAEGSYPHVILPFYLTDLEFAYNALKSNLREPLKEKRASFRCCVLPDAVMLCWRETSSWCKTINEWSGKVRESLNKKNASSRGLPLVLRFAAQNGASHLWVVTGGGGPNFLLGDAHGLDRTRLSCCRDCPCKSFQQGTYEIGMIFPIRTSETAPSVAPS